MPRRQFSFSSIGTLSQQLFAPSTKKTQKLETYSCLNFWFIATFVRASQLGFSEVRSPHLGLRNLSGKRFIGIVRCRQSFPEVH
jgi:hypothetical protein